jgi:pimeloyl-ACP methyl ester carboxylesterase
LGQGSPVLFLPGGLRRAGMCFGFLEKLSMRHSVIALDYPPVMTIQDYLSALDIIVEMEQISSMAIVGQSYGGMLAQAYLCHHSQCIERLILSSSGPANYSKSYIPIEYLCIVLARILPEKTLKNLLLGGLDKLIALPETEQAEWKRAFQHVMAEEITRNDLVSHFTVALDLIHRGLVTPNVMQGWKGPVFVMQASNDPTQQESDLPKFEKLFGRTVSFIKMGDLGHTALLFNPDKYVELLEQALA